jgi:hypothetical protein
MVASGTMQPAGMGGVEDVEVDREESVRDSDSSESSCTQRPTSRDGRPKPEEYREAMTVEVKEWLKVIDLVEL